MASTVRWVLGLVLGLGLAGTAVAQIALQSMNDIRYVSGGIGEEERGEMLLMLPDYNLKLVAAAQGSGGFLAGVRLAALDARGVTLLETTLDGPWLMARFPPGRYELQVTYGGATQKRVATIPAKGHRIEYFYWSAPDVETLKSMERQEKSSPGDAK
ncbi:MAG TPA: hypothetical protein VLD36_18490 [Burkholderiales bacterium]|jgi:hypothetical protein|nr:hypothetical protein [Burkholderiales bacterium]